MTPLLELSGMQAGYGPGTVLFGIDLRIGAGEVATLLGRNGMGKTTTVRAIMGLLPVRAGRVCLAGERIDGRPTDAIARRGVALVPEGRQVFGRLTVEENLLAFAANRRGVADPWTLARVYALFPRLRERARHLGGELSGGEQQMVAIGRALMTHPRLLILDEATEGLAPLVREEIWQCLAALRQAGQAILVIDKHVQRLLRLADRHTLLERGRVVWQGSTIELATRPDVWQRYVGV